jgi:transcriptional regulator with XRE-family HTH domain
MPASSTIPYGEAVKDYRRRSGISQDHIATITNEDLSSIRSLEAGNAPPPNPAFHLRLLQGTGVINLFVQSVLQAAEVGSSTEELEKLIDPLIEPLLGHPKIAQIFRWRVTAPEEPAQDTLTESSQIGASISEKEALNGLKEYLLPIHYPHTSMPDHAPRLVGEGKFQTPKKGVVFQSREAKLLVEALENPDHALRSAAEQAMKVFTVATQRAGAITSDSSAQEFNVRNIYEVVPTLRQAAEKSGVPVEEIMTIRDIQTEWDINRDRLQQLTRSDLKRPPQLTLLPVILKSVGGGQLLYRRSEVERVLADPKLAVTKKPEQPKTQPQDSAQPFQVVATLRQAVEKTGLPLNEIVTTRDILAEYGVNRSRIHRWTQTGHHGQPHLTPLSVRLEGAKGGQLLFRRSDVERLLANPPKGGRPRN